MSAKTSSVFKKIWDNLERVIMGTLMLSFFLNIVLQIFARVVFNHPLSFTEEISRYCFLWMVMLGFSFATKYDRHIRISLLVERFSPVIQKIINIFIYLLAFFLFCWILYVGISYVKYTAISKTPALQISRAYIAIIVPITAFLMILRSGEKIFFLVRSLLRPKTGETGELKASQSQGDTQ